MFGIEKVYIITIWTMFVIVLGSVLGYYVLPEYSRYEQFPIWQLVPIVIEVGVWFMVLNFIIEYKPKKKSK